MANLLHSKASRTRVLSYLPNNTIGNDGDIVVSNISGKGVYLCIKAGGRWFTASRLSDVKKIDKVAKNILGKNIKIRDIKNCKIDANKFVVSDKGGELKYRDSKQLLSDLDFDALSIDYKTSYCSLGQYNNKEECEANNGTWYYSENESHDSISSTAENQLLTIGQSINELDSESTLLYDGSTLEIKHNSDFDDNWQTSAQNILLKLTRDSTYSTTFGVSDVGVLRIIPSGGSMILSSSVSIGTIAEVGSDTDKILMSDLGVVKYVTGANLRSYIGAGTSSVAALNDLSDVTYSSGDLTITSLDKIVSGALEFDCSGDMIIDVDGGCIDFKDDGVKIAEFSNIMGTANLHLYSLLAAADYFWISTGASGATTITTVDVDAAVANLVFDVDGYVKFNPVGDYTINRDTSGDSAEDAKAFHIDFDRTVAASGTAAHNDIGIDLDVNSASLGTSSVIGMDIDVVGATSGTHTATGIDLDVDGSDTNIGMIINTAGTHMKLVANADANDYATFTLANTGDLTIATVGDGTTDSDLTLDADGTIVLDSATDEGTQFLKAGTIYGDITAHHSSTFFTLYEAAGASVDDFFRLQVEAHGATTLITHDNAATAAHLILDVDGDITLDAAGGDVNITSADFNIDATKGLYLDGGGDTYIAEASADLVRHYVGGDIVMILSEAGNAGNLVSMNTSCAGFVQQTITYDADDTAVFFNRGGNKAILTFDSGNITDLHLNFPNVSCNCLLLLVQDGTGSRTITNYKTFDQVGGNESTVAFAGGSNPTLTTTAGKADILSFYWDNTNHKAYGTITHNF